MKQRIIIRIAVFTAILFSGSYLLNAQENYTVSSISPEMKKNADAVIRLQEESLTINSPSSATYRMKRVVTILNEEALYMSLYFGSEDRFHSPHFGKIIIYNKDGKKVKSFGPGELKPVANYSGSSIYNDVYYKYVDPDYLTYPFTAEITYSEDYKGVFQLPDWYYYQGYDISTEKSSFSVTTPEGYNLRYYKHNLSDGEKITRDDGKINYYWEAKQIPALKEEPYSLSLREFSPAVLFSPGNFEYGGYSGSSESWNSLGIFVSKLNQGRGVIEGETVEKVKNIVASSKDTVEIIKKLYKYMQDKTRYVNISIGIGGWQPMTAQKVDNTSYGECKALSNYMKSLLDLAGIKSNYTLIMAGKYSDDVKESFPNPKFNHAILSVPLKSDTIWLECTSQKQPFNYLGSFTDDRHALEITGDGGKMFKTPKYSAEQNRQTRKASVTIDLTGNGTAEVSTSYCYFFFDEMVGLLYLDQEGMKKAITNMIDIPGFTLKSFSVSQPDADQPMISENLSLSLSRYASLMGDRILLPLNLMNRIERLPSNVAERKMDIDFRRDRMLVDTIVYKIPPGYSVTSLPQPMEYTSPFGYYKAEVTSKGNEVTYIRKMRYNKGVSPVSQYPQLLEFNKNVATADNVKIALKKL